MQQIADWLEKLGMSEYAQRFAENRVDLSVLPDLTDQDLQKLGVLLGDRRKILRAIADLKTTEKPTLQLATVIAAPQTHDAAERRQVTVMFSDLVGNELEFDGILERMSTAADPEFVLSGAVRRAYLDYRKASKSLH